MAIDAGAIRAGKAFVEMFIDDEKVNATLARVQTRLKAFGAASAAVGAGAVTAMGRVSAAVSSAAAAAGAMVMRVVRGITSSVTAATAALGAMAFTLGTLAPRGKLNALLNSFLSQSAVTEATGRWTRFVGAITGNATLRSLGNRIERLGLGAAIVQGFRTGGIGGGISATIGASIRSASSLIKTTVASALATPIRGALGVFQGAAGSIIPGLAGRAGAASGGLLAASGAAGQLTRSVSAAGFSLLGTAAKAGGFAAVISGAAVTAAKQFVSNAQDMVKASRETGESLDSLIAKKFGRNSLISAADIEAAAKLGDLMNTLKQAVSGTWAQIGAAAMPVLKGIVERGIAFANTVARIVGQNRQLISAVLTWASRLAAAAAGIAAIGGALAVAGPALSVLLSPLGLVSAGLAGLVYLFPQIRDAAADAFAWLFPNFGELLTTIRETVGGITDALMGGDISAAADVLWAGLELSWRSGGSKLREIWRDITASFRTAWTLTLQFFGDAWSVVLNGLRGAWTATQNWFARGFARVIANLTGQDAQEVLTTLEEMQQAEAAGRSAAFEKDMQDREALTQQKLEAIAKEREAQAQDDKEALDSARSRFNEAREKAREVRERAIAPEAAAGIRTASNLAAGFGSFSTAALGRIGVGGLSKLEEFAEQTAKNTADTAEAIKNAKGIQFA